MEKQPGQRFQSAHDIAFDLESVSSISANAAPAVTIKRNQWLRPGVAGLVVLGIGMVAGAWLRPSEEQIHPKLHRITFRRGTIWNARFTPDGNLF
jgi:hypothetical protein